MPVNFPELLIGNAPGSRERYPFLLLMATMIIGAWLALWLWEQSPYGQYLNHGQLIEPGPGGHGGHAHAHASTILSAMVFLGGWVLMSAAMMLPTTLPLLDTFRRLTRKRQDTASLVVLVIVGYLTAWLLFGIVAHLMSWGVSAILSQFEWVRLNSWVLTVMLLGTAGVFQFTDLKYKCLDKCRAPLSFVLRHWRGGNPQQQALTLGIHNGIYCVGCCWALMFLMFIVSTGSLGWMLLLGAVMAAEKNLPNGRHLARPLGFLLLTAAALFAVQHYPVLSP